MAKSKLKNARLPATINEGKQYFKNARVITTAQFEHLEDSLDEYGDLSGIIHNWETNEFAGGNQRTRVFAPEESKIEILTIYDPPTRTGTVAEGYVHWHGERFAYRAVRWDEEKMAGANLSANRSGGTWDWDMLANVFDPEVLLRAGFTTHDLHFTGPPPIGEGDSFGMGGGTGKAKKSDEESPMEQFISIPGDSFKIGTKEFMCGHYNPKESDRQIRRYIENCQAQDKPIEIFRNGEPMGKEEIEAISVPN